MRQSVVQLSVSDAQLPVLQRSKHNDPFGLSGVARGLDRDLDDLSGRLHGFKNHDAAMERVGIACRVLAGGSLDL